MYIVQANKIISISEVVYVNKLKVVLMVERNGQLEKFNGFTETEKNKMSEKLSKSMSAYFTQHPCELK